jgi:signal peptidase I
MTAPRAHLRIFYHGWSMWPTLQAPDVLVVEPCDGEHIARGDIIVYRQGDGPAMIAHRVKSLTSCGFRTRGDYNARSDDYVVNPRDVLGRVVFAERDGRVRRIHGGKIGALMGHLAHVRRGVITAVLWVPRRLYGLLAGSPTVKRVTSGRLSTRVISFNRPSGTELQLFLRDRPIGVLRPGEEKWVIRAPFRLLVDERSLPRPSHPGSRIEQEHDIHLV